MEEKKYKKGDNPKGQGPCKPKKEKTKEEKEAARAKQAEKKRLKKEQARLEEEAKKKKEEEGQIGQEEKEEKKTESKENKKKDKEEKKGKKKEGKKKGNEDEKKEENKEKNDNSKKNKEQKEEKKDKKDKKMSSVKFYGITNFEERSNEIKITNNRSENDEASISSSSKIIEFLSKNVKYSKVNQEIIYSLRNIFLCGSSKQTINCLNLLNSIKIFVDSVDGDDYTICTEVSSLIRKVTKLITGISEKCSGIYNTCKYLNLVADLLLTYPSNTSSMLLKELIKNKIQYFIDRRVKKIDVNNIGEKLIEEGDTILFLGKSKIFRKLLLKAKKNNINFKVIFADSNQRNQISSEIEYLSQLGVPVTYTYIKEITNLMKNVTKVFIKGDSMLVNGYLLGKSGTSLLALISKFFNKPVYVFCPSFKFMNKIILSNNIDLKKKGQNLNEVKFDYDITPSAYIETIICENGFLHASSIPVYIRELEKNDDRLIDSI